MKKQLLALAIASVTGLAASQTVDNWMASGAPVRNNSDQCWRNSAWTPATAHPDCDDAIKAPKSPERVAITLTQLPTMQMPAPAARTASIKATFAADTFFDFDRAEIRAEGRAKLQELVAQLKRFNLEVVIVVGHTDSVGTDAYNMKLGDRRAQAVKNFLVAQGLERSRIYTESKGEKQPVADNQTREGRAKNRRVEIEVIATQK